MAEKTSMTFRATHGRCSPRPSKATQRENLITPSRCSIRRSKKSRAFTICRKALRAAQFQKCGGGGGFFKKCGAAQLLAAYCQGQNGHEQKSRRGHGHCRADFEQRSEQFRRGTGSSLMLQPRWSCAHGGFVLRNAVEKFAEGQGFGDCLCARAAGGG